jgi:hypothetical protein
MHTSFLTVDNMVPTGAKGSRASTLMVPTGAKGSSAGGEEIEWSNSTKYKLAFLCRPFIIYLET